MTCDDRRDLLLLFAANALEPAEMQEMRAHLASSCTQCSGALAEAQATFAAVGYGVETIQPSQSAKARLMEKIDRAHEAEKIPDSGALRLFRYLVPSAIAAGLAVIVTHQVMMQHQQSAEVMSHALRVMVDSRDQQIQQLSGQLRSQQQTIEFIRNPDLKVVQLDGGKLQPKAVANVLWSQKANGWIFHTTGMTPTPAGKTYELWYITADSKKVRAGTFDVDASGTGELMVGLPTNIGTIAVAAVTDEPAGGVDQPTGNIQLAGKL